MIMRVPLKHNGACGAMNAYERMQKVSVGRCSVLQLQVSVTPLSDNCVVRDVSRLV